MMGVFRLDGYGTGGTVVYTNTKPGSLISPEDMTKFKHNLIDILRKDGFDNTYHDWPSVQFWLAGEIPGGMVVSLYPGRIEVKPGSAALNWYDPRNPTHVRTYKDGLKKLEHALEEASSLLEDKKEANG